MYMMWDFSNKPICFYFRGIYHIHFKRNKINTIIWVKHDYIVSFQYITCTKALVSTFSKHHIKTKNIILWSKINCIELDPKTL
jgi:hypothetical protein